MGGEGERWVTLRRRLCCLVTSVTFGGVGAGSRYWPASQPPPCYRLSNPCIPVKFSQAECLDPGQIQGVHSDLCKDPITFATIFFSVQPAVRRARGTGRAVCHSRQTKTRDIEQDGQEESVR